MDNSPEVILGLMAAYFAIVIPLALIFLAAGWRIFTKAGHPGWAVLIPVYNLYVYTQVAKRPGWWLLLYFAGLIPVVGSIGVIVVGLLDSLRIAKLFGKGSGFGIGLFLVSPIFLLILGFGSADYATDNPQGLKI
jgi:hypothetical protein